MSYTYKKVYQIEELMALRHSLRYNIELVDLLSHQKKCTKRSTLKPKGGIMYPITAFVVLQPQMPVYQLPPSATMDQEKTRVLFSPPPSSNEASSLMTPLQMNQSELETKNFAMLPGRIIPVIKIPTGKPIPNGGLPVESLQYSYISRNDGCFYSPMSPEMLWSKGKVKKSNEQKLEPALKPTMELTMELTMEPTMELTMEPTMEPTMIQQEEMNTNFSEHSISSSLLTYESSSSSEIFIKIHPSN